MSTILVVVWGWIVVVGGWVEMHVAQRFEMGELSGFLLNFF